MFVNSAVWVAIESELDFEAQYYGLCRTTRTSKEFDPSELYGNSHPSFPLSCIVNSRVTTVALAPVYPPLLATFCRPTATVRSYQPSAGKDLKPATFGDLLPCHRHRILFFILTGATSSTYLQLVSYPLLLLPRRLLPPLVLSVPGTAQGL